MIKLLFEKLGKIAEAMFLALSLCLASGQAEAETGNFNLHLEGGTGFGLTGWQAKELGLGLSGAARFEYAVNRILGVELGGGYNQFFKGSHLESLSYKQMDGAYWANGALGVRFRLYNDQRGYQWPWKKTPDHAGNLLGNLWMDLHAGYFFTGGLHRFGADAGLGFELSLFNGLQIGPFARGVYILQPNSANERDSEDGWFLLVGLSFSIALPKEDSSTFDTDLDSVSNSDDKCPKEPEDDDGFKDEDGCPDPDNDLDGIPDSQDHCSVAAEDKDGFEDEDGCPDPDNDLDGVVDVSDKCPLKAEDQDNFEDDDGCLDDDNDMDSFPDAEDKCPNKAETVNDIEDDDGCPESDRDEDGFIDTADQCPGEPEIVNGIEDADGCPDGALEKIKVGETILGEPLYFDSGMTRLKTRSKQVLDQLVETIKTHPEYAVISIRGHSDSSGGSDYNLKLSERRAKSVKEYLMKREVAEDRLKALGLGENGSLSEASLSTEENKKRRVELIIEELNLRAVGR